MNEIPARINPILDKALEYGWLPPQITSDGVYSIERASSSISYPETLFGENSDNPGFWSIGRTSEILKELHTVGVRSLVEVGAGSGDLAISLSSEGIDIVAIEPLMSGCLNISRHNVTTFCSTLEELKLPEMTIPAYGAFDVLEHLEHPEYVVSEMHRTLVSGGYLFVTVPTGSWLWGHMDDALGHYKRYKKSEIENLLAGQGFEIRSSRYLFLSLVIPAFLIRALPYRLKIKSSKSDIFRSLKRTQSPIGFTSKIGSVILWLDSLVSKYLNLPYGLSCLVVAQKP
jgi:SAM-dependent methyltransferase